MTVISETPKLVTVFGGSGYVGRHVVRALAKRGYRVRVACRRPELAHHLQPLGNVGQIQAVQANVRVRWSIDRAVEGADHVINLVGILHESGRQKFSDIQTQGARAIAEAATAAKAGFTQISALGPHSESASGYARSKVEGEAAVQAAAKRAVIFRPSIIFGPEDQFYNRFANMARFMPLLPLIGGGKTLMQPVFVGDVAEAVARSVDGKVKPGVYELGGPEVMSFRDCMQEILRVTGRKRPLISVPWWLAELKASFLGLLPNPVLTTDQVAQLKDDSIVSLEAEKQGRTLAGLGIQPQSSAVIVPTYLWRFRAAGQFSPKTLS
ncbi:NAD-dependent epimerase/dehydratase family protein [Mesorhizobium sp. NBSH29]|uniref:complex I NDUFA9 subunit family protein n=1 Tax=Mesorhizobium sp. NBSH29 TaxID=2654249 RepID=UPI0018968C37|nr:complex I NDUFA9 subunit family protein [Mesorhizobium sp. NBSH29]QPC86290.1 NAD-dependent epimerase/dehydratase family protein [Mesorhizobium sp. NBSH29]